VQILNKTPVGRLHETQTYDLNYRKYEHSDIAA